MSTKSKTVASPVTAGDIVAAALFDFIGFLTTQPTIPVGETANCTPALDRLAEFMEDRGLPADKASLPVENWQEMLD